MNKKLLLAVAVMAGTPFLAIAQEVNTTYIENVISGLIAVLGKLPALFLAVAVIFTLWGVTKFVAAGDNDEARDAGKKSMIWGVLGVVIMVSLWGIINLVQKTVFTGADDDKPSPIELPGVDNS